MSGKTKLARRMARHVVDGTITPEQARAMLGKKPFPAPPRGAVKSAAPGAG